MLEELNSIEDEKARQYIEILLNKIKNLQPENLELREEIEKLLDKSKKPNPEEHISKTVPGSSPYQNNNKQDYIIKLEDIYKTYTMGGTEVQANAGININILRGEFVVIMGASGSGKSTLMNIIGCLDRPTKGSYFLDGKEVSQLTDDELAYIRNQKIGFVFQKFHLLAGSTARENVELPMIYAGANPADRMKISREALINVGLKDRIDHNPNELSGGQMQRVAIARALVNKSPIILADEPTGNLDSKSGSEIMALFQELHRQGRTIILITHNPEVAKYGTRVIKLKDGIILSDKIVHASERIMLKSEIKEPDSEFKYKIRGRMHMRQCFKVAWNSLKANKLRSILTLLGIIIGVSAVIVMTSIGEGTNYSVMQEISALGANVIFLARGTGENVVKGTIDTAARNLSLLDVDAIKAKCPLIISIAPQVSRSATIRYGSNNMFANLIGTTPDFIEVRRFVIDKGRFFSEEENKARATVCVIGSFVAETLFGKDDNPVGKTLQVNFTSGQVIRLTIIGVMQEKGQTMGQDNDNQIFTPINTVQRKIFYSRYVQTIFLEAKSADDIPEAIEQIKSVLLPLHKNNIKNFDIKSQEEIRQSAERTMGAFTLMLAGIAFVSLVVGGIGIMNIMLVSVTERTREIGLRKAIGARKKDILFQFLIESMVLGITGGILGIVIGVGVAKLYTIITAYSSLNMLSKTFISLQTIILSFTVSALVGIFFGIYPSRKAASLDPIEALRYE